MSLKSLLPSIWNEDEKGGDLFTSLQKEIDRVFDSFKTLSPGPVGVSVLATRMDVSESEKDIRVTAELPGVKPEDLKVELVDDVLTVSGEKKTEVKDEKEEEGRRYHRIERSYGSFSRSLRLPPGVDETAIEAAFKDGVLTVTVKKPAELLAATKKIEVKAA